MPRKLPAYRRPTPVPTSPPSAPPAPWTFHFRPRNSAQALAADLFPRGSVLALVGPAGSGKTLVALALAVGEVHRHAAERVTLVRPCVEAAEHPLGWLGGGLDEKLDPHYLAFAEAIDLVAKGFPAKRQRRLALSFARGLTFRDEIVILDEAQNCTFAELKLVLTRLGQGAKLIIVGDPEQADICNSGLVKFLARMDGADGYGHVKFADDDVVRHPLMAGWLRRLR